MGTSDGNAACISDISTLVTCLQWTKNIVAADINPEMNSIEEMPDGRLYTKGPTDVFRILHEQLPLAAKIKMPLLHSRVAMALLRCVAAFQTMEREVVASGKAHFELLVRHSCGSQQQG